LTIRNNPLYKIKGGFTMIITKEEYLAKTAKTRAKHGIAEKIASFLAGEINSGELKNAKKGLNAKYSIEAITGQKHIHYYNNEIALNKIFKDKLNIILPINKAITEQSYRATEMLVEVK